MKFFKFRKLQIVLILVALLGVVLQFVSRVVNSSEPGYWIWAGINPNSISSEIWEKSEIYLHQGFYGKVRNSIQFIPRGLAPHKIPSQKLRLVYRLATLPPAVLIGDIFERQSLRWEQHGNRIVGLQIDFDSPTKKLKDYADFLTELRKVVPKDFELSITGLGDWLASGNRKELIQLANQTDFIAFMFYRLNRPIRPVGRYVKLLSHFKRNYRIGMLPEQLNDSVMSEATKSRFYRGSIVFLQSGDKKL